MSEPAPPPETDDFGPGNRARSAHERADELRVRHGELANGILVTAETVQRARDHAEKSLERAKAAHRSASEHHYAAEKAHLRAAAAHEQAALRADDSHGSEHQDAAEKHRDAAEMHESAGAMQFDEYLAASQKASRSCLPSAAERR